MILLQDLTNEEVLADAIEERENDNEVDNGNCVESSVTLLTTNVRLLYLIYVLLLLHISV